MFTQKLKSILSPSAAESVEIKMTRSCRIALLNGEMISATPGETHKVSPRSAKDLEGAGVCEIVGSAERAAAYVKTTESYLPPVVTPDPAPESWAALPKCFGDWWDLDEKQRALKLRYQQTEQALLSANPGFDFPATWGGSSFASRASIAAQCATGATTGVAAMKLGEESLRRRNAIVARLTELASSIDAWSAKHADELIRLHVTCGDWLLEKHGELSELCREVSDVGFSIFQSRISALGLSEKKGRDLFLGSSDWKRFEKIPPSRPACKVAHQLPNGETRNMFGGFPTQAVGFLFRYLPEITETKTLLKSARTELAKTKKAAA